MQPPFRGPNRFTRRAPIPAERLPTKPLPNSLQRRFYFEHEIDWWLRCQLEGRPWTPSAPRTDEPLRLMTRAAVLGRLAVSHVTLHRMEKAGRFPRSIRAVPPGIWDSAEQAEIAAR